jgi:2-deoxy-D-gluconate 3-dehydrogenase
VAAEVEALGRRATGVAADLADRDAVQALATRLAAEHRVDVLVNNAGTIRRTPAVDMTMEDWDLVRVVNLDSVWVLTQTFGREMVKRGDGAVVTIASLLSFQGGVTVPGYAATKHAVAGLTKAFANEWASAGVRVNAVAPGYVETNNTQALRADAERREAISARIPANRWATPEDIAPAVVYLASPAAAYVHGHVLTVDGGWMGR